jgi:3-keto-disaccharide hydrolase
MQEHRFRMLPFLSCCSVILALAAAGTGAGGAQEFRSLFNGKDLAGWDGNPKFWSVKDGAITGQTTAENPTPGNTFLIWKGGTLKDFELRLKFRIQGNNSGVQYRSKDLGNWVVSGYQADIDAAGQYTGIFYEERGRGILGQVGEKVTVGADGKPVKTGSVGDPKEIKAAVRKDDWNEYVIVARGNHFTQAINGRTTVEAIDEDTAKRAMEGILALQLHAGQPMTIQFKEIRLRVLPPGE